MIDYQKLCIVAAVFNRGLLKSSLATPSIYLVARSLLIITPHAGAYGAACDTCNCRGTSLAA